MEFTNLFKYCPSCGSASFSSNSSKSKHCQTCDFTLYANSAAATAAFIFNAQRELLVCRRAYEPGKGTLDLPGGFVDKDETAEEAIARELKEELNAELTSSRYLFSLPNSYEYSNLDVSTLDLFFLCKLKNTENLKASDDVDSVEFIPIAELEPSLFGLSSIRKAVTLFLANPSLF